MAKRTLPSLQNGPLPTYPNGGPIFALPNAPHRIEGARWLGAHTTSTPEGRLVLGALPEGQAFVYEGRAKRGETFGFATWPDNSTVAWALHRGARLLAPLAIEIAQADLGPQGSWLIHLPHKRPYTRILLAQHSYRWWSGKEPGASLFCPHAHPALPQAERPRAIIAHALLQALSDHAHSYSRKPRPVADAHTLGLHSGWSRPSWCLGATSWTTHAYTHAIKKALMPTIARHIIAQPRFPAFAITVASATREAKGLLCVPTLGLSFQHAPAPCPGFKKALQDAWNHAWHKGDLGPPFEWYAPACEVPIASIDVDPATISRHALLAALPRPKRKTGATKPAHQPFPSSPRAPT